MRFEFQRTQVQKIISQRNGYMVLGLGCLCVCVIQMISIFFLIGREKVIIVPPWIEKSFWVSAEQISPEYLSEMTSYFASLRLNITPDNASMQRENLLRYTDPTYYDELKTQLIKEADTIHDQHMTIAFFPVNVKVDTKQFKAMIEGDIKSSVGDIALPTKRVSYLLAFKYDAGRLLVKSFEEVKHV